MALAYITVLGKSVTLYVMNPLVYNIACCPHIRNIPVTDLAHPLIRPTLHAHIYL